MMKSDDYTYGDMNRILQEVRQNPENHEYPVELIEIFQKIENDLLSDFEKLPVVKLAKGINQTIEILKSRNPFMQAWENSPQSKMMKQMGDINSSLGFDSKLQKAFEVPSWAKMAQQINELTELIPEALGLFHESFSLLSEQGWYVSPRIFDEIPPSKVSFYLKSENANEFEDYIIQEMETILPKIIDDCQKSFPNRNDIIEEIQKSYNHGYYSAVVALCYTQADGISNDLFGVGFFDKDQNDGYKLKSYQKLRKLEFNHSIGIIKQLGISTNEITAYSNRKDLQQEDKKKVSFNRHLVLHGHSTEYGTKINAVRAICILDFLQFLTRAVELK